MSIYHSRHPTDSKKNHTGPGTNLSVTEIQHNHEIKTANFLAECMYMYQPNGYFTAFLIFHLEETSSA